MLNRRRLLVLGATLGGATALPFTRLIPVDAEDRDPIHNPHRIGQPAAGTGVRPTVTAFTEQMPVPPVLQPVQSASGVDVYKIAIQASTAELLPGLKTPVLTYGGSLVGPTIRARTGRPVKVTYVNQLTEQANVHLHGGHVPAASDGHPMDVIQPGQSRVYDYPNRQQGATLWYHDHSHHTEAEHVYRGLHGFYLIDDPAENRLALPQGKYDVPIMLRDAQFDQDGGLVFFDDPANRTTILANGKIQPYFPVAARKYRFRLLNAANEHVFRLNLGGKEMVQIASDSGLLPAPVPLTELVLSSAERAEIVIDFARYPVGTKLVLSNGSDPVLRFDVVRPAIDLSRLPGTLRPLPALPAATIERDVAMSFDLAGTGPVGLVNGKPYDPNRIDFQIKRGTTEIWNITNADTIPGVQHTFHLHMTNFRVLERDGGKPLPQDAGLKDTVHVSENGKMRVQATFADHLGTYVYHCHFLEHSSLGMMAQMEIVP
ncbi:multicopper oxidase domain-containing protein [Streptosporangium sp. NBC_01639]|uniref:multicopper oxidase family protein n=1 Tax=Streptosporangium sp. NBC_01639 TaxID=2975948 RepID=UPI00386C785D|nr:multicopper oxidase domain-containing protein [Streptosporangium sp. NBC_01639]